MYTLKQTSRCDKNKNSRGNSVRHCACIGSVTGLHNADDVNGMNQDPPAFIALVQHDDVTPWQVILLVQACIVFCWII